MIAQMWTMSHYFCGSPVRGSRCFKFNNNRPNKVNFGIVNIGCITRSLLLPLADPRGGARDARPPWGSKFFHFHAVFGKKLKNNSTFGSWRPPLGKILDPPLITVTKKPPEETSCCNNICGKLYKIFGPSLTHSV